MVRLQVSSSNYNCDITLERRVTFLRGDSGTGKTGLVDVINEQRAGNLDITVNCEKPVVAIITEMISDEIPFLKSYKNRVLIFDDLLMSELCVFGNTILDIAVKNDLYFLIISRAELGKYEEKELGLDYSVNSILMLDYDKENPKNHFTRKVNDLYPECDFQKRR